MGRPVKVEKLLPGDRIRIREGSPFEREVTYSKSHATDVDLWCVHLRNGPNMDMPVGAEVFAETMMRLTEVPCFLCKQVQTIAYNKASHATPRCVICGECDEVTTADVMAMIAESKPLIRFDVDLTYVIAYSTGVTCPARTSQLSRVRASDEEEALAEALIILKKRLTRAGSLNDGDVLDVITGTTRPCAD